MICQSAPASHDLYIQRCTCPQKAANGFCAGIEAVDACCHYFCNAYPLAAWTGCIKWNRRWRQKIREREKRWVSEQKIKNDVQVFPMAFVHNVLVAGATAKRTNNHSIFLCPYVAEWTLFYSVVLFFSARCTCEYVDICAYKPVRPFNFFCVFQVEVTTTISYLSIQNFPLRFCIHISPLWWSNPGNSLGAVIGDKIKNRKKNIWKKKSVIRFICEADANIMFLIISLKMKTANHTMIAHNRTYLQSCQKSSCLTKKGKRHIKIKHSCKLPCA